MQKQVNGCLWIPQFSLNSSHVIQLVHADEDGNLTLESLILGIDSDISRWASMMTHP